MSHLRDMERMVATQFIQDMLKQGFWLGVDDGGEPCDYPEHDWAKPRNNLDDILSHMFSVDDELLYVYERIEGAHGYAMKVIGWARFIYGNDGYDVINDYTTSLEPYMSDVHVLEDKLS